MTEHPLTDAKCREIANNLCFRWQSHVHQDEVLYSEDDMRAAADWQLDQVLQAWEQYLEEPGTYTQAIRCFDQKLKEMRPALEALPDE